MDEKRDATHGIGQQAPLDVEKQAKEDKKARERDAAADRRPDQGQVALLRSELMEALRSALRGFHMAHSGPLMALGEEGESDLFHDALSGVAELLPTAAQVKDRRAAEKRHEEAVAERSPVHGGETSGDVGADLGTPEQSGIMDTSEEKEAQSGGKAETHKHR